MELCRAWTLAARRADRLIEAMRQLRQIAAGLWYLDSHTVGLGGLKGSVRMTVVGNAGELLLYSPVALDPADVADLERLGQVTRIMAPNTFHHFFLRSCMAAFPDAQVLVPAGLEAKIGPIPGAVTMSRESLSDLPADIERFVFTGHKIRETVLFHRPSRTLITADLLYNFQREHQPLEKAMFRLIGCYGAPRLAFYHRFVIEDKASVRELIETVHQWRPDRIIMSHGRIVEREDSAELFARAWAPLS